IPRVVRFGPLLDVMLVDARTFRGKNSPNREESEVAFLGAAQIAWLERALRESTATWKIVAVDMPLALVVPDPARAGPPTHDGVANGVEGAPRGRELEIARLLGSIHEA